MYLVISPFLFAMYSLDNALNEKNKSSIIKRNNGEFPTESLKAISWGFHW